MSLLRRHLLLNRYKDLDQYILNVTSVTPQTSNEGELLRGIYFSVVSGEYGIWVHFHGQSTYVQPNTETGIHLDIDSENAVTDNAIFTGSIIRVYVNEVEIGAQATIRGAIVNSIVKWPSKTDSTWSLQFDEQKANYDIKIPNHITNIVAGTFGNIAFDSNSQNNGQLILHNNLNQIASVGGRYTSGYTSFFSNGVLSGGVWNIDDVAIATYGTDEDYVTSSNTKKLADSLFGNFYYATVTLNEGLEEIGEQSLAGIGYNKTNFTTLEIPSTVKKIKAKAFAYSDTNIKITTLKFNQPNGMQIELPTAGSTSGMLYYKSAKEMTIYTDNEIIKNYDWAADNVTATLLHLNGTPWEV